MKIFKFGIEVFDAKLKEYGGFNHFLAYKIFKGKYRYLDIYLKKQFKIQKVHEDPEYYYDGYHNTLWIGWILISYGT